MPHPDVMIRIRLHLARVNRERIFTDQEGRQCLAFVGLDPANGETRGKLAHSMSPEQRAAGERGEFCGWWETVGTKNQANTAGRAAKGGQ